MTAQEAYYVIADLTRHGILNAKQEYPSMLTDSVSEHILDEIISHEPQIIEYAEQHCDMVVDYAQDLIKGKAEELALMAKTHKNPDARDLTRFIGRKISSVLGHNKRAILASCYGAEFGDLDDLVVEEENTGGE